MKMPLFIDLLSQKKMERSEAGKKEVRQEKRERGIKRVDRVEGRRNQGREETEFKENILFLKFKNVKNL